MAGFTARSPSITSAEKLMTYELGSRRNCLRAPSPAASWYSKVSVTGAAAASNLAGSAGAAALNSALVSRAVFAASSSFSENGRGASTGTSCGTRSSGRPALSRYCVSCQLLSVAPRLEKTACTTPFSTETVFSVVSARTVSTGGNGGAAGAVEGAGDAAPETFVVPAGTAES